MTKRTNEQLTAEIIERLFSRNDYDRLITSRADFRPASSFGTALGRVVPAMRERGYLFSIADCFDGKKVECGFRSMVGDSHWLNLTKSRFIVAFHGEEPSAICEAALAAMDAEEAEDD